MAKAQEKKKPGKEAADNSQPIEYTIFTTAAVPPGEKKPDPETHSVTEDMDLALAQAQKLFDTEKFQAVEVKKKYFEEKTGRTINMTLRMFTAREKKDRSLIYLSALAVAAGAAAFGLTFFLGK